MPHCLLSPKLLAFVLPQTDPAVSPTSPRSENVPTIALALWRFTHVLNNGMKTESEKEREREREREREKKDHHEPAPGSAQQSRRADLVFVYRANRLLTGTRQTGSAGLGYRYARIHG